MLGATGHNKIEAEEHEAKKARPQGKDEQTSWDEPVRQPRIYLRFARVIGIIKDFDELAYFMRGRHGSKG